MWCTALIPMFPCAEADRGRICEFKASLISLASSKSTRGYTVLKKKRSKQEIKFINQVLKNKSFKQFKQQAHRCKGI